MKIKLLTIVTGAFLSVTVAAACGVVTSTEPPSIDETSNPSRADASPVQSDEQASPSSPVSSEQSDGVYHNSDYRFAFEIPEGWSLEERTWIAMEGGEPLHTLVLTKDDFEIIFQYKTVFEEGRIGPSGLPAGDLQVKPDNLLVFGQPTSEYVLTYQDRIKIVFYDIRFEDLRGSILLQQIAGPDDNYSYEEAKLPEGIRADLSALVQSLSRTGAYKLPESVAMLAEFPVILPMEKSYYSQIYDTTVANACGPAAAMMVLDFYQLEDSLQTVIKKLQELPSPGAFDPNCYVNTVCTSPSALAELLHEYGLDTRLHENWTLTEVFAVLSAGYPIIVDILWDTTTQSLGHFVVIYGVDLDQELIYYHDPYRGSEMTTTWDEFATLWEGRVDVGDPLVPEGHRFWGLEVRPFQSSGSTG